MERVLRHEERCFNGWFSPYSLHGVCVLRVNCVLDKIRGFIVQRFFSFFADFEFGVA
jgi:hypothetical protein